MALNLLEKVAHPPWQKRKNQILIHHGRRGRSRYSSTMAEEVDPDTHPPWQKRKIQILIHHGRRGRSRYSSQSDIWGSRWRCQGAFKEICTVVIETSTFKTITKSQKAS